MNTMINTVILETVFFLPTTEILFMSHHMTMFFCHLSTKKGFSANHQICPCHMNCNTAQNVLGCLFFISVMGPHPLPVLFSMRESIMEKRHFPIQVIIGGLD